MDRLSLDGYVKNDSGIYLPSNRIIVPSESDMKNFVGGDKMKGLEQMLEKVELLDVYAKGTVALYTAPLMIYNFPSIDTSMHIHGSNDGNYLYGGDVRPIGCNEPFKRMNGYECAMADYWLKQGGVDPIYPKGF